MLFPSPAAADLASLVTLFRFFFFLKFFCDVVSFSFFFLSLSCCSHDGLFSEPNNVVIRNATFSQLKQIFNPYSPHLHPQSFPGASSKDCTEEGPNVFGCVGQKDRTGHYRNHALVSPKVSTFAAPQRGCAYPCCALYVIQ